MILLRTCSLRPKILLSHTSSYVLRDCSMDKSFTALCTMARTSSTCSITKQLKPYTQLYFNIINQIWLSIFIVNNRIIWKFTTVLFLIDFNMSRVIYRTIITGSSPQVIFCHTITNPFSSLCHSYLLCSPRLSSSLPPPPQTPIHLYLLCSPSLSSSPKVILFKVSLSICIVPPSRSLILTL